MNLYLNLKFNTFSYGFNHKFGFNILYLFIFMPVFKSKSITKDRTKK